MSSTQRPARGPTSWRTAAGLEAVAFLVVQGRPAERAVDAVVAGQHDDVLVVDAAGGAQGGRRRGPSELLACRSRRRHRSGRPGRRAAALRPAGARAEAVVGTEPGIGDVPGRHAVTAEPARAPAAGRHDLRDSSRGLGRRSPASAMNFRSDEFCLPKRLAIRLTGAPASRISQIVALSSSENRISPSAPCDPSASPDGRWRDGWPLAGWPATRCCGVVGPSRSRRRRGRGRRAGCRT